MKINYVQLGEIEGYAVCVWLEAVPTCLDICATIDCIISEIATKKIKNKSLVFNYFKYTYSL